jgi:hypothetical protein
VPACALLSGVRRVTGAAPSKRAPGKILFLKFIEQGATVLAQDAIARATRAVGRDHVFFCVFESNRAILDVIGTVPAANIITIRDQALTTFVVDFLQAAMTIRRLRIDTVIDMEFFSRASAIFAFMTGRGDPRRPASLYGRAALSRQPDDAPHSVPAAAAHLDAVLGTG